MGRADGVAWYELASAPGFRYPIDGDLSVFDDLFGRKAVFSQVREFE